MKLIIAGGRDHWLTREDFAKLDDLHRMHGISEEVCGCQTGVDSCGKVWAIMRTIPVRDFPPDWKRHGHSAGPMRNEAMAEYADAVALFTGNRGTRDMHSAALRHSLQIFDLR